MPRHEMQRAAIAAYPQLSCFPDKSTVVAKGVKWSGDTTGKQVQQSWGVYPDVFCPSEYTFTFLQNVLDEVMQLFPSKYIHIGGDECPKDYWKISPFCQQLIKEKNLKDEHGLQSYFIGRIEKYLNSKGRNIIGWDEILEGGLAPNAADALRDQALATIKVIDDQRAKNFKVVSGDDRAAAAAMQAVADHIA